MCSIWERFEQSRLRSLFERARPKSCHLIFKLKRAKQHIPFIESGVRLFFSALLWKNIFSAKEKGTRNLMSCLCNFKSNVHMPKTSKTWWKGALVYVHIHVAVRSRKHWRRKKAPKQKKDHHNKRMKYKMQKRISTLKCVLHYHWMGTEKRKENIKNEYSSSSSSSSSKLSKAKIFIYLYKCDGET